MAPACASISPAATGMPAARPNPRAASALSPRPSAVPGPTTSAPIRSNPAPARAASPTLSKNSCGQRRAWGEIVPLARNRARRARQRAGGAKGEKVRQVEEMTGFGEGSRRVPRQPEKLRRLHFRGDGAADVTQDVVAAALMSPASSIARWSIQTMMSRWGSPLGPTEAKRRRDRGRRATGRVEADAGDRIGATPEPRDRFAHRGRGRAPNVGGRMLDDLAQFPPDRDRPSGAGEQLPVAVENARPRAPRPHVDADDRSVHPFLALMAQARAFITLPAGASGRWRRRRINPCVRRNERGARSWPTKALNGGLDAAASRDDLVSTKAFE